LRKLNPHLDQAGIEHCEDDLILKRILSSSGTNRQFINGSPTTLSVLKNLGDQLVDLHGPHDHQSLLSPETQLRLLDSFARAEEQLEEYRKHYRQLQTLLAEHAALNTAETAREQELDLLRHQITEITSANIAAAEEKEESEDVTNWRATANDSLSWPARSRTSCPEADDLPSRNSQKLSDSFASLKRSMARWRNFRRPTQLLWSSFPKLRARSPPMQKNSTSTRNSSPHWSNACRCLKL
jgi:DNA repair ATPase RecN